MSTSVNKNGIHRRCHGMPRRQPPPVTAWAKRGSTQRAPQPPLPGRLQSRATRRSSPRIWSSTSCRAAATVPATAAGGAQPTGRRALSCLPLWELQSADELLAATALTEPGLSRPAQHATASLCAGSVTETPHLLFAPSVLSAAEALAWLSHPAAGHRKVHAAEHAQQAIIQVRLRCKCSWPLKLLALPLNAPPPLHADVQLTPPSSAAPPQPQRSLAPSGPASYCKGMVRHTHSWHPRPLAPCGPSLHQNLPQHSLTSSGSAGW